MKLALAIVLAAGTAAAQDIKVEGTLGTIDAGAVQLAVDKASPQIEGCFKEHAGTLRYVGGAVTLRLRVGKDGAVRSAAAQSDLGAWEVEKCLMKLARGMSFGKPRGGEAEVALPLSFPARAEAAAGDGGELGGKLAALGRCGAAGDVQVVAYVGPGGKITTAGFSSDVPLPDGWGDCALGKARGLKLTDPRGRVVKVAARLP